LITEHKIDGSMLDQLALLFGGRTRDAQLSVGNAMLATILGDNADDVARLVGSVSGMSSGNATRLMALAAPAVLGGVATAAPAGGFSAPSLMSFLASQKAYLGAFAPLGLSGLLGLGELGTAGAPAWAAVGSAPLPVSSSRATGVAVQSGGAAMPMPSTLQFLMPWLLLASLLLLAFSGLRSCLSRTEPSATEIAAAPEVTEPAPEPVATDVPAAEPTKLTMPSGNVLTVAPGSVGENLYNFLVSAETGSKTFLFDGLTFDAGSATLDASSQATISAIAEILKEFGTVTVSVDGYTDNTGPREGNVRLSEERAQAVLTALSAAGVDAARMAAHGHGDDSPVADNGTEEGRAQNRRTELTATKN
jgi:outer membrane protein OmpA-like peptidoglycan-associated protein